MTRVISSPSSSTKGVFTRIFVTPEFAARVDGTQLTDGRFHTNVEAHAKIEVHRQAVGKPLLFLLEFPSFR